MTIGLIIAIFVLFVGFLAVAVAYRHGLSKGYEQMANNNMELDNALRQKERELKKEQLRSEGYHTQLSQMACQVCAAYDANLDLTDKLGKTEAELKQAQRRAESKLNRATRPTKHNKR